MNNDPILADADNSVTTSPVSVSPRKIKCPFYPLVKDELLWLRSQKLINNAAFVYFALRLENPHCDRPVQVNTKEFVVAWGIPESSLYEALAKLRDIKALLFLNKTLSIQWQQDFDIWELKNVTTANSQQEVYSENPELATKPQKKLRLVRKKSEISEKQELKPLQSKASETPHTIQTSSELSDSEEEDLSTAKEEQALGALVQENAVQKEEEDVPSIDESANSNEEIIDACGHIELVEGILAHAENNCCRISPSHREKLMGYSKLQLEATLSYFNRNIGECRKAIKTAVLDRALITGKYP